MRWWWTGFWEQMNLQDFTSVWDLLELLFAEILQFVSQLTDRFSQAIKSDKRTEEIILYICRFRRCWERLETLQKTEIKTHQLHTSPNNLHQYQILNLFLIVFNQFYQVWGSPDAILMNVTHVLSSSLISTWCNKWEKKTYKLKY